MNRVHLGISKVNAIANDKRTNGNKKIWMCINFQNKSRAATAIRTKISGVHCKNGSLSLVFFAICFVRKRNCLDVYLTQTKLQLIEFFGSIFGFKIECELKCKQNNAHVMHHAQSLFLSVVLLE